MKTYKINVKVSFTLEQEIKAVSDTEAEKIACNIAKQRFKYNGSVKEDRPINFQVQAIDSKY